MGSGPMGPLYNVILTYSGPIIPLRGHLFLTLAIWAPGPAFGLWLLASTVFYLNGPNTKGKTCTITAAVEGLHIGTLND